MLKKTKSMAWEIDNSSLIKISDQRVSYNQCREYACRDIASNLTKVKEMKFPDVLEIPKGTEFHFIGRVDTGEICLNHPALYYNSFEKRDFISFTTINNRNISHYKGNAFFIYDIISEDIVHIFPLDSNTDLYAKKEHELTVFPSFWITLKELEETTEKLGVYNQITCRTKRNGKIIKPIAVLVFDKITDDIQKIAKDFDIGYVIVHPDDDVIKYNDDIIKDEPKLNKVSELMREMYGINIISALVKNS